MSTSNIELVQHILVETSFILQHTESKTKEHVINDEVLCRAVVRSIENKIPDLDHFLRQLL
jgi:hypothetical protein